MGYLGNIYHEKGGSSAKLTILLFSNIQYSEYRTSFVLTNKMQSLSRLVTFKLLLDTENASSNKLLRIETLIFDLLSLQTMLNYLCCSNSCDIIIVPIYVILFKL